MTTEIVQIDQNGNVDTEVFPEEMLLDSEPVVTYDIPITESVDEAWQGFQAKATAFFADLPERATAFVKNNRQSINTLTIFHSWHLRSSWLALCIWFSLLGVT
jgi:hypothetical protein